MAYKGDELVRFDWAIKRLLRQKANFVVLEIKSMLLRTGVSMQDIADRLGFPDQSYLGRFFKRYTGMSLTEYRRRK